MSKTLSKENLRESFRSLTSGVRMATVLSSRSSWAWEAPRAFYLSLMGLNLQTTLTLAAAAIFSGLDIFQFKSIQNYFINERR